MNTANSNISINVEHNANIKMVKPPQLTFQVYGPNGAQISSPTDKHIQETIMKNLKPRPTSWDTTVLQHSKNLHDPLEDILDKYVEAVSKEILKEQLDIAKSAGVLYTYTPMHGVGYRYVERVFRENGIKLVAVEEQKDPHPDFPTVK